MSVFLCKVQEVYRADSETQATNLIEEAKHDGRFTLLKSSTEYKTVKVKGQIEDEYWLTTLVKEFNLPKEPTTTVTVTYDVDNGIFPAPVSKADDDEDSPWEE